MMAEDRYGGRRVRLRKDASYGHRADDYLTGEQLERGPQGVVVRSEAAEGRLFLHVNLENVPFEVRVPADEVELI